MKKIKKILLLINPKKKIPSSFTDELICFLEKRNCSVTVYPDNTDPVSAYDLAVVLGGDGSIIEAASVVSSDGVPILGINFGRVGYLAELEATDLSLLEKVIAGDYVTEERIMMDAYVTHSDGSVTKLSPALNDIVLSNGPIARLLNFDVLCDGVVIKRCRADGIIIATPTGSTAYSMSAGGPILSPMLDAFCLTPICAHSLDSRPIVVPGNSTLSLSSITTSKNDVYVSVDGRSAEKLSDGDTVTVGRSCVTAKLIRLENNSFLSALNSKL